MRTSPTVRSLTVLIALLTGAALLLVPSPAQAGQHHRFTRWAAASTAKLHPGVQAYTQGSQCTTNFVFSDRRGRVYLGYAAHCAGKGEATDTNGCRTSSYPIGTKVR